MFSAVFVIFCLLVCILFRFRLDRGTNGNFLEYRVCEFAKALMMMLVIIHHIAQRIHDVEGASELYFSVLFKLSGPYLCALFFFFSGYGLTYSLLNKPDYLKGFKQRILNLVVPYVIANIAFFIHLLIRTFHETGAAGIHLALFNTIRRVVVLECSGMTLVNFAWFIDELILFYFLFYLCNRFVSAWKSLGLQFLFLTAMVTLFIYWGWGAWRYYSVFGFIFGQGIYLITAQHKTKIERLAYTGIYIGVCTIFIVTIFSLLKTFSSIQVSSFLVMKAPLFILPVAFLLSHAEARDIPLFRKIASISLEAYMYQGLAFAISSPLRFHLTKIELISSSMSDVLYLGLVLVLSITFGFVFHALNKQVFNIIGITASQRRFPS